MARDLTASVVSEVDKDAVEPIVFAELNFSSGYVRVWNGVGDLSWDSKTWTGVGWLGQISSVSETTRIEAQGATLTLSGIPSELIATALGEYYQGRSCNIWLGFVDSDGAVIADPIGPFGYIMDTMQIDEGGETAEITIQVENKLRRLEQASNRRWTHEDQQIDYPGDIGFEFVASLQNKEITW